MTTWFTIYKFFDKFQLFYVTGKIKTSKQKNATIYSLRFY